MDQDQAPALNGMLFLDEWIDHAESCPRDPLSREASVPYQSIWKRWMLHLQAHVDADGQPVSAVEWSEARPEHVQRFLLGSKSTGRSSGSYADVTMRRYWRVLDRVYEFAMKRGRVVNNPARALVHGNRPKPEDHLGTILLPRLWEAARAQLPVSGDGRSTEIRDRAMLLLLFDHALQPQEVRNLTCADVLEPSGGLRQALQLDGPGPRQRRKLELTEEAADALNAWMSLRSLVVGPDCSHVFCTTSGVAMSHDAIRKQVTKVIEQALVVCGEEYRPARIGPQILRNTCLVHWLNAGIPADVVAVRAGLKNAKGLHRLRKAVNPEIRAALSASVAAVLK